MLLILPFDRQFFKISSWYYWLMQSFYKEDSYVVVSWTSLKDTLQDTLRSSVMPGHMVDPDQLTPLQSYGYGFMVSQAVCSMQSYRLYISYMRSGVVASGQHTLQLICSQQIQHWR